MITLSFDYILLLTDVSGIEVGLHCSPAVLHSQFVIHTVAIVTSELVSRLKSLWVKDELYPIYNAWDNQLQLAAEHNFLQSWHPSPLPSVYRNATHTFFTATSLQCPRTDLVDATISKSWLMRSSSIICHKKLRISTHSLVLPQMLLTWAHTRCLRKRLLYNKGNEGLDFKMVFAPLEVTVSPPNLVGKVKKKLKTLNSSWLFHSFFELPRASYSSLELIRINFKWQNRTTSNRTVPDTACTWEVF